MCSNTRSAYFYPECSITPSLDQAVRGLPHNREVTMYPLGVSGTQEAKPIFGGLYFLVVVENPCHIVNRLSRLQCELEPHSNTSLHIDAAAAPQPPVNLTRGQILVSRHSVDVASPDDAPGSPKIRPGCDSVAQAQNLEVSSSRQSSLNGIRQ